GPARSGAATDRRECCARTWTRCRSRSGRASSTRAPSTGSCPRAATTCTSPAWAARRRTSRRTGTSGVAVVALCQPAEETAEGARAMIDDGLFERIPRPDVILGQHVMPTPAGMLGARPGVMTSAGDSLEVRLRGRGGHGSMPQASVDPVVMAAATGMRLQGIVAREVAPNEPAVVTVGALQAGSKANVIPDEAVLKLNVRTYDEDVRRRVLDAIRRIVE